MPKDVRAIAEIGLRKDYVFLDTVGADENTHQHVPQHYLITTKESQVFFFLFSFFLWVQMRTRTSTCHSTISSPQRSRRFFSFFFFFFCGCR